MNDSERNSVTLRNGPWYYVAQSTDELHKVTDDLKRDIVRLDDDVFALERKVDNSIVKVKNDINDVKQDFFTLNYSLDDSIIAIDNKIMDIHYHLKKNAKTALACIACVMIVYAIMLAWLFMLI